MIRGHNTTLLESEDELKKQIATDHRNLNVRTFKYRYYILCVSLE